MLKPEDIIEDLNTETKLRFGIVEKIEGDMIWAWWGSTIKIAQQKKDEKNHTLYTDYDKYIKLYNPKITNWRARFEEKNKHG